MLEQRMSDFIIETIRTGLRGTLVAHLGIEILDVGDGFVKGRMPIDERTQQPQGALHGGASLAFAETLGGVGSAYYLDLEKQFPVGLEINANHLRAATSGYVYGTATILHMGRRTHVWEIKIVDEEDKLVCASRFTQAIIDIGAAE
uniref:1,4-dihydroxy-2-naphthoyl-CoA hydrolase n=1 Tax=Candidatus Kentrum sp. FM TaxID=2126340 RepID=A0A450TV30_9GAMM|nr:MAG: 1,4-dihydroxy-2-naphthoyl-CoA hydrolase [Candidatus Kentron sp. FM]VFJ72708.1 MAG: 1,4-dihydroxy-2-naphthoyl-CoA hydrolase [Candidatus Kentron sp. FM]VFK14678.1 MAG: 1,4-dihydroxy-2-naphthoyl-CoA hydrolase [Candidatus Kentron sp. FM]